MIVVLDVAQLLTARERIVLEQAVAGASSSMADETVAGFRTRYADIDRRLEAGLSEAGPRER